MSDIPLHAIRRPEQAGHSHSYHGSMSTSRRKQDKKRNGKYASDEALGLKYFVQTFAQIFFMY